MLKKYKNLLIGVSVIVWILIVGCGIAVDNNSNQLKKAAISSDLTHNKKIVTIKTPEQIEQTRITKTPSKTKNNIFGGGNYYAGKHFEVGTYDIKVVSGRVGLVIVDSSAGGISAMMGTSEKYTEQEYKNIEFPDGAKLKISGIKIKLVKVK